MVLIGGVRGYLLQSCDVETGREVIAKDYDKRQPLFCGSDQQIILNCDPSENFHAERELDVSLSLVELF